MTDQSTIAQLNPILVLADADLLLADQAVGDGTFVTKKITAANVSAKFSADAGAAASGYADAATVSAAAALVSETNAAASEGVATTKAGVATTQAGNAASSAASASTDAGTAATDAATATTQAGIATAAAGTATTDAGTATTQAGIATTQAGLAAAAAAITAQFSFITTAGMLTAFGALITVVDGSVCVTGGRSAKGDGGDAVFYYDASDTTTADNGGTVRVDSQNRRWKMIVKGPVVPEVFGTIGTEDGALFQAALTAGYDVTGTHGVTYVIKSGVSFPSGRTYFGNGDTLAFYYGGYFGAGGANVRWLNSVAVGVKVSTNVPGNCFQSAQADTQLLDFHISGDWSYPFGFGGADRFKARGIVDGSTATLAQACGLVDGCNDWELDLTVYDPYGFQCQVRQYVGGLTCARGNLKLKSYAPVRTQSITATASQTVFTFTLPTVPGGLTRPGIQLDGVPVATGDVSGGFTINATATPVIVVTFGTGRTVGQVVKLMAWRALEVININGPVTDCIFEIDANGGGDSGAVCGDDNGYGSPKRNKFSGIIRNQAACGYIEETIAGADNDFSGMTVVDCCLTNTDIVHSSGGVLAGTSGVGGGRFINTTTPPSMKYGFTFNGTTPIDDGAVSKPIVIAPSSFSGAFTRKLNLNQYSSSVLLGGVDVQGVPLIEAPGSILADLIASWSTNPTASSFWTYGASGSGWARDTSDPRNGVACLKTVAGSYVDIVPVAAKLFLGSVLEIELEHKADASASAYISVFLDIGGTYPAVNVVLNNTAWTQNRLCIPLSGAARIYLIRIGGTTNGVLVDSIKVGYRPLP